MLGGLLDLHGDVVVVFEIFSEPDRGEVAPAQLLDYHISIQQDLPHMDRVVPPDLVVRHPFILAGVVVLKETGPHRILQGRELLSPVLLPNQPMLVLHLPPVTRRLRILQNVPLLLPICVRCRIPIQVLITSELLIVDGSFMSVLLGPFSLVGLRLVFVHFILDEAVSLAVKDGLGEFMGECLCGAELRCGCIKVSLWLVFV